MSKTLQLMLLLGLMVGLWSHHPTTVAEGLDPIGTMRPKRFVSYHTYAPFTWQGVLNPQTDTIALASPTIEREGEAIAVLFTPTSAAEGYLAPVLAPTRPAATRVASATPRATPSPARTTPTATVSPTPTPPDWMVQLNDLRAIAGLPPVTENEAWSAAAIEHAQYMVKNDELTHSQVPTNPYYSATGAEAAASSNVWVSGRTELTPTTIINNWMVAPFHGIALLDPELQAVGYGEFRAEDGGVQMAAVLDVQRGLTTTLLTTETYPIMFPRDGAVSPLTTFQGEEFPDPFSQCPGFAVPVGAPIYLQLGAGELVPEVGGHTLTINGKLTSHCLFDETSYRHRDAGEQAVGRGILNARDAIIVIPRHPLPAGAIVEMSIESNGERYTWSFTVAKSP